MLVTWCNSCCFLKRVGKPAIKLLAFGYICHGLHQKTQQTYTNKIHKQSFTICKCTACCNNNPGYWSLFCICKTETPYNLADCAIPDPSTGAAGDRQPTLFLVLLLRRGEGRKSRVLLRHLTQTKGIFTQKRPDHMVWWHLQSCTPVSLRASDTAVQWVITAGPLTTDQSLFIQVELIFSHF